MAKRRNRKRSGGIAREDYTQGGRVGYRKGERIDIDRRTGKPIVRNQQVGTPSRVPTPAPTPAPSAKEIAEYNAATAAAIAAQNAQNAANQGGGISGSTGPTASVASPAPTPAPQPDMIAEDLDQTGGQNEYNQSYGINIPGLP